MNDQNNTSQVIDKRLVGNPNVYLIISSSTVLGREYEWMTYGICKCTEQEVLKNENLILEIVKERGLEVYEKVVNNIGHTQIRVADPETVLLMKNYKSVFFRDIREKLVYDFYTAKNCGTPNFTKKQKLHWLLGINRIECAYDISGDEKEDSIRDKTIKSYSTSNKYPIDREWVESGCDGKPDRKHVLLIVPLHPWRIIAWNICRLLCISLIAYLGWKIVDWLF